MTASVKFIQRDDCATRTTNKRSQAISNASQLASLKTDGIKVLIASLPANYPPDSILSFAFPPRRVSWRRLSAPGHRIPHSKKNKTTEPPNRLLLETASAFALVWHHHTHLPQHPFTSCPPPPPFSLSPFHPKHWKSTSGRRAAKGRRGWGWYRYRTRRES